MNATEELKRIALRFPECNPHVEPLPSGATMLDLTICGVDYGAQYLPSHNIFGLSKTEDASPFWEGFDEVYHTSEELEARIADLLQSKKI